MRTFISVIIVHFFLAGCSREKKESSYPLTTTELTSNNWKQFTGIYNNNSYQNNSPVYYSEVRFSGRNQYVGINKSEPPLTYTLVSGNYIFEELNSKIVWPDIDTVLWGVNQTPYPFYRADWELQFRNDSMLFFKRTYIDTTRAGIYEGINSIVVLKKG